MTKPRRGPLFIQFAGPSGSGKPQPGGPVTTLAVGEEKGRPDPGDVTSMMVGEERDRPGPGGETTRAVGEESGPR